MTNGTRPEVKHDPNYAACVCWCGRQIVRIPWQHVGDTTATCGADDCTPGATPRSNVA